MKPLGHFLLAFATFAASGGAFVGAMPSVLETVDPAVALYLSLIMVLLAVMAAFAAGRFSKETP